MTDPRQGNRIADLERRVAALESALAASQATRPQPALPSAIAEAPAAEAPPPPATGAAPPSIPAAEADARQPVEPTRFLAWAGAGLVVLGAVFLVSLAVARGWLTPEVRVVGAALLGAGLLGVGLRMAAGRALLGRLLAASGLITFYLDAWAASQVFDFYGEGAALVVMVVVSAVALGVAAWMKEAATAALATIGGMAAPALVSAAADIDPSPAGFAVYTVTAFAVVMVVYWWTGWRSLYLTAAVSVLVLLVVAVTEASGEGGTSRTVFVALIIALVVGSAPMIRSALASSRSLADPKDSPIERFFEPVLLGLTPAVVGAGPVAFAVLVGVLFELEDRPAAVVALVMAVVAGTLAWAAFLGADSKGQGELRGYAQAYAVAVAPLATTGAGLLVSTDAALGMAGAVVLAGTTLGQRLSAPALTWTSHVSTAALVVIYVFRIPLTASGEADLTLGGVLADIGVVAVFAMVSRLAGPPGEIRTRAVRSIYGVLAWVGVLGVLLETLSRLDNGQALVSVAWALSGLGLLVVARQRRSRPASLVAMSTLAVVVAKLVLSDLSGIDPVWRIFLFLAIGLLFLWAAARFRRAIAPQTAGAGQSSPTAGEKD